MKIAQASIDERGKISGGKAGNQSGRELNISTNNSKWEYAIRAKDPKVRKNIPIIAKAGVNNRRIGYNQARRNDLWNQAKHFLCIGGIYINTSCDCSSFVTTVLELAHYSINGKWLPLDISNNCLTTSNMRSKLLSTGLFEVIKNPNKEDIQVGDVLLNESKHCSIVISL